MQLKFKRCECCEWLIKENELPVCLIKGEQVGLLTCCDKFKEKTGEHISF